MIKPFQLYKGKVIGPKSRFWDSRGEKFYARSHAEAVAIAHNRKRLKCQQTLKVEPKLSLWAWAKSLFATYADEMGEANG